MNSATAVIANKLALQPTRKTKNNKSVKTATKKQTYVIPRRMLLKAVLAFLMIAILVGGGFGYVKAYNGKIYPKITIAGVKVGSLTVDEAKKALNEKTTELNLNGPKITYNGQTLTPKLDEMGVSFNIDEAITEAYKFGRQGGLKDKLMENYQALVRNYQIPISTQINQEKFDGYLSQLAQVAEKEPVNASLSIKNGAIIIASAEIGRGLDQEKLKNDLREFINSGHNGEISMVTSDLEPTINEEGTLAARAQAEKYLQAAPMTVTFETSTWTATRNEIGSWVKFNEDGQQLRATVHPDTFISWVAKQVEIPAQDREIEDGTGTVLKEGQDGRGADTDLLSVQIKDGLKNGQPNSSFALVTFAIPRGEKTVFPHAEPGRYAGRYIDINLSEQTLYAFEGSTLVNQFLISSGKRGYATPTGEYSVWGKTALQKMSGPDYYLPNVPWISWFNGEIAIHGTYWHSNFGTPMSHGCINASIGDAEWIYSWDEVGTPVYVHY